MTNSELKLALKWANDTLEDFPSPQEGAVARIIQSLPNQWVEAKRVQEIIDEMKRPWGIPRVTDLEQGIDIATGAWRQRLEALLTPKLPTLAELIEQGNDPEQYQWMQARLEGSELNFSISKPGLTESMLWGKDGTTHIADSRRITPLPGEPKLKWPGSEGQPSKVSVSDMWVDDGSSPVDALKLLADKYEELDRIKPEEVPADELWLVEYDNHQWLGKRNRKGSASYPWRVASLDGDGSDISSDSRITLIHKLVPETHTLPKGMRLADHEEHGRVVVSPEADSEGDYKVTHSDPVDVYGTDWQYVHQSELTFLDGE